MVFVAEGGFRVCCAAQQREGRAGAPSPGVWKFRCVSRDFGGDGQVLVDFWVLRVIRLFFLLAFVVVPPS